MKWLALGMAFSCGCSAGFLLYAPTMLMDPRLTTLNVYWAVAAAAGAVAAVGRAA